MKNWLNWTKEELAEQLWATEPRIRQIFRNSRHMEEARHLLFDYLNRLERDLFSMRSDTYFVNLNIGEKRNAKECIAGALEHPAIGKRVRDPFFPEADSL